MMLRLSYVAFAATLPILACGGDPEPRLDGGGRDGASDTGPVIGLPEIPWLDAGAPPVEIAPCPSGWREVATEDAIECDPYPAGGPEICDPGEAHFLGEAGCRPIGDPCPDGDYAATLPAEDSIVYVKAGASSGGDGSLASPFANLDEVNWLSVVGGTTVALAKGTYQGRLPLRAGGRVVGACVAETVLDGTTLPAPAVITVVSGGEPAVVRNLTISGAPQMGVLVGSSYGLSLRGVLIERTWRLGIAIDEAGSTLALDDVVIRDTRPGEVTGDLGRGIIIQGGSRVEAEGLIISGNRGTGLFASGAGTTAVLDDVVVRQTQPLASDGTSGGGILVRHGARLELTRIFVSENHDVGVRVTDEWSTVILKDAIIRDTIGQSDEALGRGIFVQNGGRLEATRLVLAGNRFVSVLVSQETSSVTLADTIIRDTFADDATGLGGRGLEVQSGARVEATRLIVSSNLDVGITVTGVESTLTLTDALIQDTGPREIDGLGGIALQVQFQALLDGTRVVLDGASQLGVMSVDGAVVSLRDVVIARVERAACGDTTCAVTAFGYAASAVSATLRLERFHIYDAAICGAFVADIPGPSRLASLDLLTGTISDSAIGACVQIDGYDYDRLSNGVTYRDNVTNLDTTMLPVPGATEAPSL